MREREPIEIEYKRYSDPWLIDRYFRLGSVEDALNSREETVPFSFADYHRRLDRAGIVKSAGRHTSFSEALHFFKLKQMQPGMPLERLYRTMPPTFQTSLITLHRIYDRIQNGIDKSLTRRTATALLIHPWDDQSVLVGTEQFTNRMYGKFSGALSLPMTFSKPRDTQESRIIRVLQQEVFTKAAIEGAFRNSTFSDQLLDGSVHPVVTVDILDVELTCYEMTLPQQIPQISSYKLKDHHFVSPEDLLSKPEGEVRLGVKEMVSFAAHSHGLMVEAPHITSDLNLALAEA